MTHTNTLYLTAEEQSAFLALPEALREGWTVESETGTAYEDADVLKVRAGMARFETAPEMRAYVQESLKTGKIEPTTIKEIPESALPELFFTIGARGVSVLMKVMLQSTKGDEDVAGLAGLSHIRHDILHTNASITLA